MVHVWRSLLVFVLGVAVSAPVAAQETTNDDDGSTVAAVLGAPIGGFTGVALVRTVESMTCDRADGCGPVPRIAAGLLGVGAGVFIGTEDTDRIKGAYIGAGVGFGGTTFLVGLVSAFTGFNETSAKAMIVGGVAAGAVGAILGTVLYESDDGSTDLGTQARQAVPIGVRLRF